MSTFMRSRLARSLLILIAGSLTVAHQNIAIKSWPSRSPIGELFMSIPAPVVVGLVLALLVVADMRAQHNSRDERRPYRALISVLALGTIIFGVLYLDKLIPAELALWVSTSPWGASACTIVAAVSIALVSALRARKLAGTGTVRAYWGAAEIALCVMFALNMFFIALPEIRFFFGFISPHQFTPSLSWPSFALFYSDTQRVDLNPIFDLLRSCLAWYTPEYFLTPLACVYFMALAIAFFCAGTSNILGYYGSIALAAGLCWSKVVLLSVFMITNLVTLFFVVGFSVWVLSQAYRAIAPSASPVRILRTGLLIGAAGTVCLYAYVAARGMCFLFLGASSVLLAWGALQRSPRRAHYLASLAAIVVIPGAILLSEYHGRWSSFVVDLRAGVPSFSNLYNSRPSFIDPNLEASTPDLPAYYGAIIADIPQPDGSVKRDWVYWYRSPSEFAWVFWNNFTRILKHQLPFPGGKTSWFFALLGLVGSLALMSSRRKAAMYGVAVLLFALSLLSPFLIILSPGDWRRGVAVALVFASLAGFGVYVAVRICFPRIRQGVAAVAASALVFVALGRPAIDAIAATPSGDVGIAMICPFNPVAPLFLGIKKSPRMTGQVLLVGSPQDRCVYSASRQLDAMLGGNRVRLLNLPAYSLAQVKAELASGDSVALHCGPLTGGPPLTFCEEVRSSPEAILVYSAPADRNQIWVVTKD